MIEIDAGIGTILSFESGKWSRGGSDDVQSNFQK